MKTIQLHYLFTNMVKIKIKGKEPRTIIDIELLPLTLIESGYLVQIF